MTTWTGWGEYWRRAFWPVLLTAVTGILFNSGMALAPVLQGRLLDAAVFSGWLALASVGLIPVLLLVTRGFQRGMLRAQTANLEQLGAVSGHISESVKNLRMIKLAGRETYMEDEFRSRLRQNYAAKQTVNRYDACYAPVIQIIRAIVTALVVTACAGGNLPGITAGMLAASIEFLSSLLAPVESLGMEFQNIQQGFSGIRRVDEFLALPEEEQDETLTAEAIMGPDRSVAVELKDVDFAYQPEQEVLRRVSFTARHHASLTLAGRTGVGKTTLARLILGTLTPTAGSVTVGGVPAHRIPDREKRRLFGYVEQTFQFVPGTVAQQITLGDPRITQARVESACRFVGLHETIRALPRGYEPPADGDTFSYGQCQLLSIARAVVTDPPVLLLDEITANLDAAAEERVVGVLRRACGDRTILSVSHRSAAILRCDWLVELEGGRVARQGPPEEIL